MKTTAILDLMVKDHSKIVKLLNNVKKSIGQDIVSTMKVFDKFEWELEKHIFAEEKAIFTSYNPTNIIEGYAMVPELIKEHNEILNKLRVMRKDLIKQRISDFDAFAEVLMNHKTFEENSLYPKLDQELEETQKKMIVDRISQILS
jgi:hemerythrin superfamily protein